MPGLVPCDMLPYNILSRDAGIYLVRKFGWCFRPCDPFKLLRKRKHSSSGEQGYRNYVQKDLRFWFL